MKSALQPSHFQSQCQMDLFPNSRLRHAWTKPETVPITPQESEWISWIQTGPEAPRLRLAQNPDATKKMTWQKRVLHECSQYTNTGTISFRSCFSTCKWYKQDQTLLCLTCVKRNLLHSSQSMYTTTVLSRLGNVISMCSHRNASSTIKWSFSKFTKLVIIRIKI
jgi:hypothetical protein